MSKLGVALLSKLHVFTTVAVYSGCEKHQGMMGQIFLYYLLLMNPTLAFLTVEFIPHIHTNTRRAFIWGSFDKNCGHCCL